MAGALGALALPAAAAAHVTLQPDTAPAGGFARLDVRVPNETEDAATTKVQVKFPPGFEGASTEPVPGWTAKVTKTKLAKPVTSAHGEKVTERVSTVTWTGSGAGGADRPRSVPGFRDCRWGFPTSRARASRSRRSRPTTTVRWCAGSGLPTRTSRHPR